MATREKHDQGQEGRERQEGLDGREGRRAYVTSCLATSIDEIYAP